MRISLRPAISTDATHSQGANSFYHESSKDIRVQSQTRQDDEGGEAVGEVPVGSAEIDGPDGVEDDGDGRCE